eukprot:598585-Rhodomonas_salina.2
MLLLRATLQHEREVVVPGARTMVRRAVQRRSHGTEVHEAAQYEEVVGGVVLQRPGRSIPEVSTGHVVADTQYGTHVSTGHLIPNAQDGTEKKRTRSPSVRRGSQGRGTARRSTIGQYGTALRVQKCCDA